MAILTNLFHIDLAHTGGTIGCTSDSGNGNIYAAARHTAPYDADSAQEIVSGVDAAWSAGQAAVIGENVFSASGLTPGLDVYYGVVQEASP